MQNKTKSKKQKLKEDLMILVFIIIPLGTLILLFTIKSVVIYQYYLKWPLYLMFILDLGWWLSLKTIEHRIKSKVKINIAEILFIVALILISLFLFGLGGFLLRDLILSLLLFFLGCFVWITIHVLRDVVITIREDEA